MSLTLSGSTYAILTAISWGAAVVLFRRSGESMPPAALNLFKNLIGLALLVLTFPLLGEPLFPAAPREDLLLLLVSGGLGIGIADTLLFESLNILGATRSAIVSCLYSPCIVLVAFFLLDERLDGLGWLGTLLVVLAILLAGLRRRGPQLPVPRLLEGVALGALATLLMGLAIVMVKPVLEGHSVLWSTTVRMLGGVLVLVVVGVASRTVRAQLLGALRPNPGWRFALPGAVLGTYVALLFWIAGFKYAPANVVSVLNQTSTLWTVLLATWFLREELTRLRLAAVLVGFAGSVLVLL